MKRGNLSICVFVLILFVSCSSTNQENETTSISEETSDNQPVEEIKEPVSNIWVSAKKGDIDSIKQHIAYGTDLNSKGSRRDETALIIASCQGHYEIVDLLVDKGDKYQRAQVKKVVYQNKLDVGLLERTGVEKHRENFTFSFL